MRQAILRGPRVLDLVEAPEPAPGPGEVIVRIRAALTCGTDLKTYRRGHPRLAYGPFGHEATGDVAGVGDGVDGFAEGDPVMFVPTAGCGVCAACRRGFDNLCRTQFEEIALGAYGDYLRLPPRIVRTHLFPKPEHLSYLDAAFLEPLACVIHGWQRLAPNGPAPTGPAPGGLAPEGAGVVAIIGLGAIGVLHVHEARRRGYEVVAVGRRPESLALAAQAGAQHLVDASRDDPERAIRAVAAGGADLVIECTGSIEVWEAAPRWVAPGGQVLLFGGLAEGSAPVFDATRLHYEEIDLTSAFHFRSVDVREALRLLTNGEIRPGHLITEHRPLDGIREVFVDLDRGAGAKYAVLPNGRADAEDH
jgi:L-iditol 2-dehydrogenase